MSTNLRDQFAGSILGVALGDAYGAPFEGGILERSLWRLLGLAKPKVQRYTDDASMTLTLIQSLLEDTTGNEHGSINQNPVNQNRLAKRWANNARWSRGYGPTALKVLKSIRRGADWRQASVRYFKDGSYGNGAAMRVAPIGLLFHHDKQRCDEAAEQTAVITHAHPRAIEGAKLIARATSFACNGFTPPEIIEALHNEATAEPYIKRLTRARQMIDLPLNVKAIRAELGCSIVATESVVTAIFLACRSIDSTFEDLVHTARLIGGDVDTIAAMAGGIWGAHRGASALPAAWLDRLEDRQAFENAASGLLALHQRVAGLA